MPMTLGDTPSGTNIWEAGDVKTTLAATTPSGWLECDGSAVSRTTYAALYAALGGAASVHGQGDGTTTFNLPDARGRVIVGLGTHADVNALGDRDAVAVASRTPNHGHSHSFTLPTHAHSHSLTLPTHSHSDTLAFTMPNHGHPGSSGVVNSHSHGGATSGYGGSDAVGVQVGSNFAVLTYTHYHGIAAESPGVSVSVAGSGTAACTKSGGVGNNSTSPSISGSVGNNSTSPSIDGSVATGTVPYITARLLIKT